MPEDDVGDVQVAKHRGRDLARESPAGLLVEILGSEGEMGALKQASDSVERGEGRAQDDVDLRLSTDGGLEGSDEFSRLGGGLVHLPISGDEGDALGHRERATKED